MPLNNMLNTIANSSQTLQFGAVNYHDDYKEGLEKLIEKKVASGGNELPAPRKPKKATTAIDLVSVLQQSIRQTQNGTKGHRNGKVRLPKSRIHLN